jgi:GT2 family glycosyltransferase
MKILCFICVNYNNSEYTAKMLHSIASQQFPVKTATISCIVVNNSNDPDDSLKLGDICSQYPWVRVIQSDDNLGYFGGLNLGLKEISSDKNDSVIICNNDLYFDEKFVHSFISTNYRENVYVVCPDVVTVDGDHQNPHHSKPISFFEKLRFDLYFSNYWFGVLMKFSSSLLKTLRKKIVSTIKVNKSEGCEINQGVGACYILTHKFFENCGYQLFFPWFLYGEEACLSWQIRSNGGISWFDPELIVQHDESSSTSKLPARKGYEMARTSYWGYRHLL